MRSCLVSRSLTSKESIVFLLRLRCNRLLRRQHCSSLCLQSEGHEHVANMASALGQDLVGFGAVFGRHNMRSPHFASKVSYSASPQTFAECSRSASLPTLIFLNFEHPLIPQKTVSFPLGRIQKAPRRSLMKQGMPRGLSFSCHLPLPLYWRGERSRDTIMCCYGLRALPPTRPSAVFCGFQNFTVPRLRSTSMPSWALRLNLPAFLALNLMVKSSWLPSSRRKLLPRLTKVG